MSQFLSQTIGQHMRMEQRLTPQLIQSMAILQKPVTELEAHINDALETNVALELKEPAPQDGDGEDGNGRVESDPRDDTRFGRLERLTRDYDFDSSDRVPSPARRVSSSGERDAKLGAMANAAGREISLHEYLQEQWALLDLDPEVRRAGEAVIAHLDPDGYLRVKISEISASTRVPLSEEAVEQAVKQVQKLDPVGVGARDIAECLLLQLDALPGDNQVERTLITNHLGDIAHNRLPAVAKATGYSIGEINEAITAMRSSLCLHPGYLVGDRSVPRIRPDVIVEYAGSGAGLTVRLTRGNMPELRIRDDVTEISKSKANGKDAREFAKKQIEAASALIDAVNFRRSRLLEVSRAIVEKQRDFFDVGPDGLKVFRMSDLALELGCDPSTISRTVADKYMQTPRGIFPLRYFFTGGMETEEGESVGWDRVKTRVRELVAEEDSKNPLNDDQIAARLKDEGVDISRRTVAKYRQQLDIPNARQRRKY